MKRFAPKAITPALFFLSAAFPGPAGAHARWNLDGLVKPRTDDTGLKEPRPCGGALRTDNPTVLKSGDTILVAFEETINHPGYFRIAFSPAGDQGFDDNVLVERIPEATATRYYQQTITLPNIECDDCALQLIQVMEDRSPPTNYYSCADIQLTASGTLEPDDGDSTPPANVGSVSLVSNDNSVELRWSNPEEDFFETLILMSETGFGEHPADTIQYEVNDQIGNAVVAYRGNGESYSRGELESGETYYFSLFAYDNAKNYATGIDRATRIAAESTNRAPVVRLLAEQNTQEVDSRITTTDGNVIVQALVDDLDADDRHRYDWSTSDAELIDRDFSASNLTFDPGALAPGEYTVRVSVSDDGTPSLSDSESLTFSVADTTAEETAEDDETGVSAPEDSDSDAGGESGSGAFNGFFLLLLSFLLGIRRQHCPRGMMMIRWKRRSPPQSL